LILYGGRISIAALSLGIAKAYIDGKEVPIIQTAYVLRGLSIPAGKHEILFEFKPGSYYDSTKIAIGASSLVWTLIIAAIVHSFRLINSKPE
jgi:uncharacterized membrane protein YfhO